MTKVYGLSQSLVMFKKKLIFYPNVIEVVNQKDTFIVRIDCSQSKIKSAIGLMKVMNVVDIFQFGGNKLTESDLKKIKQKINKLNKLNKCVCQEIEFKNKKDIKVTDKIDMMILISYYKQFNNVKVNGTMLTVQSDCSIKQPPKSALTRYEKQLSKIAAKDKQTYYKLQGLLCGFLI